MECGQSVMSAIDQNFPLISHTLSDKPYWKMKNNGEFQYASARKLFRENRQCDPLLKKIWHSQISFKMSFILWRVLKKKLPTDDVMQRFGQYIVSKCSCCAARNKEESLEHVFCTGETARKIWQHFAGPLGILLSNWCIRATLVSWWKAKGRTRLQCLGTMGAPYTMQIW